MKKYGIIHDKSVPFRPHTNHGIERFNQTLKNKLAVLCHERGVQWDKIVYEVVTQYKRMSHADTGREPVEFFSLDPVELNMPLTDRKILCGNQQTRSSRHLLRGSW